VRPVRRLIDSSISGLVSLLCKVYPQELDKVPARGPLIMVTNHVNFLEIPVLHKHLRPRQVTGLAKVESWDNFFVRYLFNQWGAIPVRRGEADLGALRRCMAVLKEGYILAIAPEGTRSGHGRLQEAHSGVVTLALKSKAPLLPLVFHGGETFKHSLSRFRRTPFHIAVGNQFHLQTETPRVSRETRKRIVDEIMYQLAALLPEAYRGRYSDLSKATEDFIRFTPPHKSNLQRA